uniref:RNA-directed DNA polymerase n=1 Tax=Trichuris muris TaxID=70415 RepID=A0A5S6Q0K3_TRIMR
MHSRNKICYECGRRNHLAAVCVVKGRAKIRKARAINALNSCPDKIALSDTSEPSDHEISLNSISVVGPAGQKAVVLVKLNRYELEMIYDPGATQSVISENIWNKIGSPPLETAPALIAYTEVPVETLGKTKVSVTAFGKTMHLYVHVVKKSDAPLFGLNWCMVFGLPLPKGVEIRSLRSLTPTEEVIQQRHRHNELAQHLIGLYPDVFTNTTGTMRGYEAVVHLQDKARPNVFKPRPVPFAMRAPVDDELNRLLREDVLEQVDSATMPVELASPIVCVMKPSGKILICGDFKVTINPHVILDHHPLPRFEELVTKLNGGTLFSVIDLKDAYLQMKVHPDSKKYLVIATHRGYFCHKRLPFGLSFAPALFQRTVEQILAGIEGVAVYIDDIIITGCNEHQHMERLHMALQRLQKAGVPTDASETGIGAVLSHLYPSEEERPVAFASRTLTDTEKRYATIDKEALAIVFGVTKFSQYLFGRRFTMKTDHKPLERIFGEKREVPKMATNRLRRWALSAYNYEVRYVPAKENSPADVLSRLPVQAGKVSNSERQPSGQLLNLRLTTLPVTRKELKSESCRDERLAKAITFMEKGWPERARLPDELKVYFEKKDELSFEDGILLRQGRIVAPTRLRDRILAMLHEGHPGIVAMKSMARFQVWWPGIDKEIEKHVNQCEPCQRNRQRPPEVPLIPWNVPTEPWTRIHVDIAGLFEDRYWLVVVDAHSKWLEVIPMRNTVSTCVTKRLRGLFAIFGLPKAIVSDNGPQFVSEEFEAFCDNNNITHIKTTPYHPKTNGLAERTVCLFKNRIRASSDSMDIELKLQRFLFSYTNSIHATTGRTPAELLLGRRLRTKLDLLKPSLDVHVDKKLLRQAEYHDRTSQFRSFAVGDKVYVYEPNEVSQEKGVVVEQLAESSYVVVYKGKRARKHADHPRHRFESFDVEPQAASRNEEDFGAQEPHCHQEGRRKWMFDTNETSRAPDDRGTERKLVRERRAPTRPYDKYLRNPMLK